jgi:hypothetical protein
MLYSHGCTPELVQQACSPPDQCAAAVEGACGTESTACKAAAGSPKSSHCQACEACAFGAPASAAANCTFPLLYDTCGDRSHDPQGNYVLEDYGPFDNPPALMEPCKCFHADGSYACPTIPDHGHHMEPAPGCSFDMLAGVMWFQRQKQYLLANGVAVVTVNTRLFDGWNIDPPSWAAGEDPAFFAALATAMQAGTPPPPPSRFRPPGTVLGAQEIFTTVNPYRKYFLRRMLSSDNHASPP